MILCLCDVCMFFIHCDTCMCMNVAIFTTLVVNEIDEVYRPEIMM